VTLYTAFFDESGHEGQDFLVSAGLVFATAQVPEFETAWRAAIAPLKHLHLRELWKPGAEVNGNTLTALLVRAAEVAGRFSFQTFSSVLNMHEYREVDEEIAVSECIGYPFALCARLSDVQVRQWARRNGVVGDVGLVFENRPGIGDVYEVFKRDNVRPPTFENKGSPCLEAADLLAWAFLAKVASSPNLHRAKAILSSIPACLHSHDFIGRNAIRGICGRIQSKVGLQVPTRTELDKPIAFHNSPKRNRKEFRRMGNGAPEYPNER
jgi:hypothetical protein